MSSAQSSNDKELLGLLEELAGQEERTLLQARVSRLRSYWSGEVERVSSRNADLTSLERKILEAHREDLGFLVRQACAMLVIEQEKRGTVELPRNEAGELIEPATRPEIREQIERLRARPFDLPELTTPMDALMRLMAGEGSAGPSLREMAGAGELVAPSAALRIYRGIGLQYEGLDREATEILTGVYSRPCRPNEKVSAASFLGMGLADAGDPAGAARWFELWANTGEYAPQAVRSWLFNAIQAGDLGAYRRAMDLYREWDLDSRADTQDYLSRKRTGWFDGRWQPTPQAMQLVASRNLDDEHTRGIISLFRSAEGESGELVESCGRWSLLVEGVGLDPDHAQERIVAFRALPSRSRQAFLAIALDKIEFMDLVGTGQWTDEELREGVLASLEALLGRKRTHGGEL